MLEVSILALAVFLNLLVALIVLLRNSGELINRLFFGLAVSFVAFSVFNYFSLHPVYLSQLDWIRLDVAAGAFIFLFAYLIFSAFPNQQFIENKFARALMVLGTFALAGLALTPYVFSRMHLTANGAQPEPGPAIALLALQHLSLFLASLVIITKKFRRSSGRVRQQMKYILAGTTMALLFIIVFNFAFVQVLGITAFVPVGSMGILFFTGSFAYAVIKHRLLAIRLVIARSVAYILTITAFIAVYTAIFILISYFVLDDGTLDVRQHVAYLVLSFVLAPTLYILKRFFDKTTQKLFYQEAYDSQEVLDKISDVIVGTVDIKSLRLHVREAIKKHLRIKEVTLLIQGTDTIHAGGRYAAYSQSDLSSIMQSLKSLHHEVLSVEDLDGKDMKIKHYLHKNGDSLVVRLKTRRAIVGYLLLGDKLNGMLYSDQDVKVLSIIADELAIAIQNATQFEEIENFNQTLQQKVDEATKRLRGANEKLKALDEAKDDFITMASHQLRTPLTAVKGYVSMMRDGAFGKVTRDQHDALSGAFQGSQQMVSLVTDLLNVSRMRTGKFTIEAYSTDLAGIVDAQIKQLADTARLREVNLSFVKPRNFPELVIDEIKVTQVIMNFIDNAIYYTPAGGHVKVELSETPSHLEFKVQDDGIGVPESDQGRLFAKFYRSDNAKNMRPDGTGLGLFMAKKVIDAQGGELIFHSEENKGSVFGFRFSKSNFTDKSPHKS